MNKTDVLALLIYVNELDGRHSPNEAKVMAWSEVFDDAAPGMTLSFAKSVAKSHYGKYDVMVAPSTFTMKWRQNQDLQAVANFSSERHCSKNGCQCTHTEPCYKGWIDNPDQGFTKPCRTCREDLAIAVSNIAPLGERTDADHAAIRLRHRKGVE